MSTIVCTSVIKPRAKAVILRVRLVFTARKKEGERYALMFMVAAISAADTEMAAIMNTNSINLTGKMPRPVQRLSPEGQREADILGDFV